MAQYIYTLEISSSACIAGPGFATIEFFFEEGVVSKSSVSDFEERGIFIEKVKKGKKELKGEIK